MRIIIDAMGGDNAPGEIVLGAVQAAKELGCEIVLVGRGAEILQALRAKGIENLPKGVEVANAEDTVDMHDDPATVVKKRRDSSMVVGLRMLSEGGGDAFISAGSTGALLTASTLIVKRIRGIRRAAIATVFPTTKGHCLLIDSGANAECTPEFLLQFACMGSLYAERILKIEKPRVALLNIGAEETKGTSLQREAYQMLRKFSESGKINFTGNIEARDVLLSGADVIVADGFSGNILLKSTEGAAKFISCNLREVFLRNPMTKFAALLCRKPIREMQKKIDYHEVGGTAFLGIAKPIVKAHGSSDAQAIRSAVRQTIAAAESGFSAAIEEQSEWMDLAKEQEHAE